MGVRKIRREDLIDAVRQRPFQPLVLHVSDGAKFEIRHPEMVMITRHAALVGQPDADSPPPAIDRYQLVDLLHITRIESIGSGQQVRDDGH